MTVATYQPDLVTIAFAGVPVTGFAPGTFISAVRNEDSFNLSVGSGGDATRAKSGNRSGRVTVTLLGSSASNAALSALAAIDERLGTSVGPLLVKDLSGADVIVAGTAWIVKPPDIEKSNEETNREWIFETDVLEMTAGGNVPTT